MIRTGMKLGSKSMIKMTSYFISQVASWFPRNVRIKFNGPRNCTYTNFVTSAKIYHTYHTGQN